MTEYTFTANYKPIEEKPIVISFDELHGESHDKGWTVNWEFNSDIDPALLKYNHCTTYTQCREVDANVATDLDNGAWNYRLDNLETGGIHDEDLVIDEGLFKIEGVNSNTSLKSFNVDLPKLTNGTNMFYQCTGLTSFNVDLSNVTHGAFMFSGCSALTSFSSALPNLTNGSSMFYGCTSLQSFNGDLSSMTDGYGMFYQCRSLTSFSGDLSSMTHGLLMFNYCTVLESFYGDLTSLTYGDMMFYACTNLTEFESDLSSLTSALAMFGGSNENSTKLNLASVQNIANTINDLTGETPNDSWGWATIYIGMQKSLKSDDEKAPINEALAAIRAKGWTVNELYA